MIESGIVKLTLAERIRLARRRVDNLRAGAGEYDQANRTFAIRAAEDHLDSLLAQARKIARAV